MSIDDATARLHVRLWSESEFANGQAAWDQLLSESTADPLFLSWDWQYRWWIHHASLLKAQLRVIAVFNRDRLVGLGPFYRHSVRVRRIVPVRRLELIGIAWRHPQAVYSDYLDLIAAVHYRSAVTAAIAEWLRCDRSWDEMALCSVRLGSDLAQLVENDGNALGYRRDVDPIHGWRVRLSGDFDEFLARLDSAVRRKVWQQRRKLARAEIEQPRTGQSAEYLAQLERYVAVRWGDDSSRDALHRAFHRDLAAALERRGELRLSRLLSGARTLSVLYAIRKRDTVYYIQSAFAPDGPRGISPGYLHFGYAIEAACQEHAASFDFLPGRGRQRDYKRDFPAERVDLVNCQIVRAAFLKRAYVLYDRIGRGRSSATRTL